MNLQLIKKLCSLNTNKLKKELIKFLKSKDYEIAYNKDYILTQGNIPICLIAHMDTVFKAPPVIDNFYYDNIKKVLWAPGGAGFDDRAGIYVIIQLIDAGFRPHVIFTDGEETGGIGATLLTSTYKNFPFPCKMLIELDRANEKDAIFYDCNNKDFTKKILSFGFEDDWGTFTDISILAPIWGIAAVNLSVGYEDEHSGMERLHCNWLDKTIDKVAKILSKEENLSYYKYIPCVSKKKIGHSLYGNFSSCLLCGEKDILKLNYVDQRPCSFYLCDQCLNVYYGGQIG